MELFLDEVIIRLLPILITSHYTVTKQSALADYLVIDYSIPQVVAAL